MSQHQQQQTNDELARTLGRIEGTLERFEQTLEKFDHRLFGNGQPGELSQLDHRLNVIEEFKSVIKGGFATLSGITALLGGTELYHLIFGKR